MSKRSLTKILCVFLAMFLISCNSEKKVNSIKPYTFPEETPDNLLEITLENLDIFELSLENDTTATLNAYVLTNGDWKKVNEVSALIKKEEQNFIGIRNQSKDLLEIYINGTKQEIDLLNYFNQSQYLHVTKLPEEKNITGETPVFAMHEGTSTLSLEKLDAEEVYKISTKILVFTISLNTNT